MTALDREPLFAFCKALENASAGEESIFRREASKRDLETSVWKMDHKLSAAAYHVERLELLVEKTRTKLEVGSGATAAVDIPDLPFAGQAIATSEIVLRDDRVPFEMEAFFGAGRSALDHFAQMVSRFVKGRDFLSMSKLGPFAVRCRSVHALWKFVANEWEAWTSCFIEYRNDLVHRVVSKTAAARTRSLNPGPSFAKKESRPLKGTTEVLFLVPRKLDRAMAISRWDILGFHPALDSDEMMPSPGVYRTTTSGSINRNGVTTEEWKQSGYVVQEGYLPVDEFVADFNTCLRNLAAGALTILKDHGFVHVSSE